ncbi:Phospholipase B1, membrane-associated [Frankliniella fusca]|uniref:Phospholipase B1, membrane-associated n=1 Tax=Frankliniella fusca TaxID=407009 RepID=A0AAE1HCP8_9NEOP|nr:Phospholipase B1, membrane-associated [Frankliniella fusca]
MYMIGSLWLSRRDGTQFSAAQPAVYILPLPAAPGPRAERSSSTATPFPRGASSPSSIAVVARVSSRLQLLLVDNMIPERLLLLAVLVAAAVAAGSRTRDAPDTMEEVLGPVLVPRRMLPASVAEFRAQRKSYWRLLNLVRPPPLQVWRILRARNRLQPQFGPSVPFPCPLDGQRSTPRPTSVHRLRPGDVDVVGAIGDSMTAGSGALALGPLDISLEDRGVAFATGGWGSWRSSLTLANILKAYNPRLRGWASATSLSVDKASRFNVAEPMAATRDVVHQAKILAARMSQEVNMKEDWKLVTVLIGANEMCSVCFEEPAAFLRREREALVRGLDTLMALLPRTMVVVVIAPGEDVGFKDELGRLPAWCEVMNRFECPCVFGDRFQDAVPRHRKVYKELQRMQREVVAMDRYRIREDFAVVSAPFMSGPGQLLPFKLSNGNGTDWTFFSTDCFHFSQKGSAIAGAGLWNNLLEPEDGKTEWAPLGALLRGLRCPSAERPYLCTWRNC